MKRQLIQLFFIYENDMSIYKLIYLSQGAGRSNDSTPKKSVCVVESIYTSWSNPISDISSVNNKN